MEYIENEYLKVGIATHGAELSSIFDKKRNKELLWQADPTYWKRHAPVLFPIVGNVNGGVFKYKGKSYPMSAHGFARDTDFELVKKDDNSVSFSLRSTAETKEKYPFDFELIITHILEENTINVVWDIVNTSDSEPLYYSIGGHPAFACPINDGEKRSDYKVKFEKDSLTYSLIIPDTREVDYQNPSTIELKDGILDITDTLFDKDALIFDDYQVQKASLCTPDGKPYITLSCKGFPSFGLWSHPSPDAHYVCLEPWLGRCDNKGFDGELPEKYGEQCLEAGKAKTEQYQITIS